MIQSLNVNGWKNPWTDIGHNVYVRMWYSMANYLLCTESH